MNRWISACVFLVAATLCACTNATTRADYAPTDHAIVCGTVLDAGTGILEAHALVEGPDGKSTHTDSNGRFALEGFAIGTDGEVTAKTEDGRRASVRLRHLAAGRLEVVLQLAAR